MNAPSAAICPTCKGSGKKRRAWDMTLLGGKRGRQEQICAACRGTGQVDPVRVCTACGQWIDVCTCPKSKIIKLWKVDEMNGVNWVQGQQRWRVEFSRGGTHYYMGQFEDKALAVRCRMEADNTPTEQLPALRQKYAELKKAGVKVVEPEPAETHGVGLTREEYAETIEQLDQDAPAEIDEDQIDTGLMSIYSWTVTEERPDKLTALITAVYAAEQLFKEALAARDQADARACDAERVATEAWNNLAKALAELGQTTALDRSYLGFLREEITRS